MRYDSYQNSIICLNFFKTHLIVLIDRLFLINQTNNNTIGKMHNCPKLRQKKTFNWYKELVCWGNIKYVWYIEKYKIRTLRSRISCNFNSHYKTVSHSDKTNKHNSFTTCKWLEKNSSNFKILKTLSNDKISSSL